MFDHTTLSNQIAGLILEKLSLEVPSADTDLIQTGLLDSLALVNLVVILEQKFGLKISIDNLELDNFRSITKIAEFVVIHRATNQIDKIISIN